MPTTAFDILGTLFSLRAVREAFVERMAPPHAADLWLAQGLRDYLAIGMAGGYRPLSEVLAAEVPRTFAAAGVPFGEEARDRIMSSLQALRPAPGAGEAMAELRDAGWRVIAVTNGGREHTEGLLDRGGLADTVRDVVSCEELEVAKPDPRVYEAAARQADGDLWMVAAHAWDILGANRAGLRTAWVSALEGAWLDPLPPPDVRAPDLPSTVRLVLEAQRAAVTPPR